MAGHKERLRGHQLEERRRRVYEAWAKGRPQYLIAQDEDVHPSQVVRDLNHVLAALREKNLGHQDLIRNEQLAQIAVAEKELWDAWERSKKPKERNKAKKTEGAGKTDAEGKPVPGSAPTSSQAEKVTEGRDGNPKFMAELRALWELRAKLLGLLITRDDDPSGGPSIVVKVYGFDPNNRPDQPRAIGPPAGG